VLALHGDEERRSAFGVVDAVRAGTVRQQLHDPVHIVVPYGV
jgi:hypothetical protein